MGILFRRMLYITSLCSPKRRITDGVCELAELGFRNIELTGRTEFYAHIEEGLLDFKKEYKLNFLIHNYFPPQKDNFVLNLATKNPDLREKTLNLIRQAINLSKKFGNNLYTIHPGYRYDLLPKLKEGFFIKESQRSNYKEDFYQTLNKVLDEIIPDGFKIAVENLCPQSSDERYSFLAGPEDIEQFLNYYHDRPNVGILLDFGHLNVASNRLIFDKETIVNNLFVKYPDRIFGIHISENDNQVDYHNISSLDSWQIEFLYKFKEKIRSIPIVLEWHSSANSSTYKRYKIIGNKFKDSQEKTLYKLKK